jgi:hypothetical protein
MGEGFYRRSGGKFPHGGGWIFPVQYGGKESGISVMQPLYNVDKKNYLCPVLRR